MPPADHFLAVADPLPAPILLVDRDGLVAAASRAAVDLLGLPKRPAGVPLADRVADPGYVLADYLRACRRSTMPLPGRVGWRLPGRADPVPCRCTGGALRPAADGTGGGVVLRMFRTDQRPSPFAALLRQADIVRAERRRRRAAQDERRKIEAQVLHAQKLESLGVLAGGIAHDFNNLLTSILGFSDLALSEVPADAMAARYVGEAVKAARRAAELTQQMLAYSGKGRFVVQPVDLSAVISDMARLLEISVSKKCVLQYRLATALPAVEADVSQLRQVMMNLVINASEAIGDRSGVVAVTTGVMHCDRGYLAEAYLDEGLPDGLYVYIEVADTGCGMTEDVRRKLFDPFFTTKFTGRGLGLAAVLGIVRGHRGAIKVYSEPDKGTTFKVLLPAAPAAAGPLPADAAPAAGGWRGSGVVLIADDEEEVRTLARHMVERLGFEAVAVADGRRAVDVFRAQPDRFKLVLLDLTMPHLSGEDTFRELRRLRADVRALLMSGYNEQTATSRFAGKGLAGFVQKPFTFQDLRAAVRAAVEKSVAAGG